MRIVVWTVAIVMVSEAIARLILLASGNYPRVNEYTSTQDAIGVALNVIIAAMMFYLLFHNQ